MLTFVHRLLRATTDIRREEVVSTLLLATTVFLLMMSYYVMKTVREPLILAGDAASLVEGGGAAVKSYLAAAQALLLFALVPLYSWLVDNVAPLKLITGVLLGFAGCLELFYVSARLGVPYLGVVFYVWVGIFSLTVIAQFWSHAASRHTDEAGKRLFPVIALGMTIGAASGGGVAAVLFSYGIGEYEMLHVAAVLLVVALLLHRAADARLLTPPVDEGGATGETDTTGGFGLVLRRPYLRWIALLILMLNLANTTGEYILSERVSQAAATAGGDVEAWIGTFYGSFYSTVNVVAIGIQAFLVSRVVRWVGIRGALFVLPVVALGAYGAAALGAGLAVFRWTKVAENATDYSLMNTLKGMLWLPVPSDDTYKAKAAIDTFVVRAGDVLSAAAVWAGLHLLSADPRGFALANVGIVALWLLVTWRLTRFGQLTEAQAEAS